MQIDALVKIELALDGTYKIVQLRPYTPGDSIPSALTTGYHTQKATEYLANAQSVREHQRAASAVKAHARSYPTHGHCTICGECGKKNSTCGGLGYHTGEPFTGEAC